MEKLEAIEILKACQPLARRVIVNPETSLTGQDIGLLADFDRVYDAHMATTDEILREANMLMEEVAMLVAALSSNRDSVNAIRPDKTEI